MQALRAISRNTTQFGRLGRSPGQLQQKRGMSGGEDDGVHRVNWWDAPTNPDVWEKHQLAWWTTAFYGGVYWLVAGGSKDDKQAAAAK